jgi:hypothetical protein
MAQLMYDKLNDFGTLSAAGDFPNTLFFGRRTLERMTVNLHFPTMPTAAAGVVITISMAPDSSGSPGTWVIVATSQTLALADIKKGIYKIALPEPAPTDKYQHMKVTLAATTFTGGEIRALLSTYRGK